MKTVYKNETYYRLSDNEADRQVNAGIAVYAPKSAWKRNVRDFVKTEKASNTEEPTAPKKEKKAAKHEQNKRK
jgi:hypothetical protein